MPKQVEQLNDWVKKEDFIQHIKDTVIPDCDASGQAEMARDWRISLQFMEPCITMVDRNEYR